MSIDFRPNESVSGKPSKSLENELSSIAASPFETEEQASEREARLAELIGIIRSEFLLVSNGLEKLERTQVTEENFEKIEIVGDKLALLAQISGDLFGYPEIRKEFDEAIAYLSNVFLQIVGKKLSESEDPKRWFPRYSEMRGKLERSLRVLGNSR